MKINQEKQELYDKLVYAMTQNWDLDALERVLDKQETLVVTQIKGYIADSQRKIDDQNANRPGFLASAEKKQNYKSTLSTAQYNIDDKNEELKEIEEKGLTSNLLSKYVMDRTDGGHNHTALSGDLTLIKNPPQAAMDFQAYMESRFAPQLEVTRAHGLRHVTLLAPSHETLDYLHDLRTRYDEKNIASDPEVQKHLAEWQVQMDSPFGKYKYPGAQVDAMLDDVYDPRRALQEEMTRRYGLTQMEQARLYVLYDQAKAHEGEVVEDEHGHRHVSPAEALEPLIEFINQVIASRGPTKMPESKREK